MRGVRSAAAAAGAALAWGLVERRWFALRHQTVPALSAQAGSALRVLHLSDLHLVPDDEPMARFVRASLRHGPDLVVVTGDILGHLRAVGDAVALLTDVVRGRRGVVVLGSNDRFGPTAKNPLRYLRGPSAVGAGARLDTDRLVAGLSDAGWHVLRNQRVRVETPAGAIDVVGLDDPHIGAARPALVDWSPSAANTAMRLGVVHAPYVDAVDRFAAHDVDLTLAGHTHGGQVRIPGIGALVDNCDLPLHMARGLSAYTQRMWLHVSAGLGTSLYAPVRFACRPEATVLDIVARRVAATTPAHERAGTAPGPPVDATAL